MEKGMNPYIVYVRTNPNGYITAVNSSAFLTDTNGWTEIDKGCGDRYALAQGNYFPEPISTMDGVYRYKLVDGKPVECTPEEIAEQEKANHVEPEASTDEVLNALLGCNIMNRLQAAEQLRKALQMFAANLADEKAMEVVAVYDPWTVGKWYNIGDFLTYGENGVGDPQLYKVNIEHTAQADWTPDTSPSLFKAIGLDDEGYPVWSQPTGAHDAYNAGDIVNYNGTLYKSLIDGNVYSPDAYPSGWEAVE